MAKELVKSKLAYCAMHKDGQTFLLAEDDILEGNTLIEMNSKKIGAEIVFKGNNGDFASFNGFTYEAWYQASYFKFNEMRLFVEESPTLPSYIRFFLGECSLYSEEENRIIICYPIVKLFESGIMIVEFRTINSDRPVMIDKFIKSHVNLFNTSFEEIKVPPTLSKLSTHSYYQYSLDKPSIFLRAKILYLSKEHDKVVDELTELSDDESSFTFKYAPLSNEGYDTLSSLAQTIFTTIGYVISKPRKGIEYVFLGQKKLIKQGKFWAGKPNIHLINFSNQKKTAKENEELYKKDFARIMTRSMIDDDNISDYTSKDYRFFNDFSTYINASTTLCVWSLSGILKEEKFKDLNRGHLIYGQQVKIEMLEYGYILHKGLYERCLAYKDLDEVLLTREYLVKFSQAMRESSYFGEIRDLLEHGWNEMGVKEIKKDILEMLEIKGVSSSLAEARHTRKIDGKLTVLFGIFAVPQLAKEVVGPLWEIVGFWRPLEKTYSNLFLIFVTVLMIIGIIKIFSKQRS